MDIPMLLAPPTPNRSTSPTSPNRQPSRSPRPYRRRTLPSPTQRFSAALNLRNAAYLPSPLPTPGNSRAPSPLLLGGRRRREHTWRPSTGGSESGTEADDELTKRLPAPPEKRKRTLSEEDKYYGEEEEEGAEDAVGRGRQRKRRTDVQDGSAKKKRRKGIVFVRRGIEIGLMGILVVVVLYNGGEGTVWREVISWKIEISSWILIFASVIFLYPLRILLRKIPFELPRSLDPSPLLYPTLFPILVSLSLTQPGAAGRNPYILTNIILSLSTLPPSFLSSQDLHWALSLVPVVISSYFDSGLISRGNTLSFIPPIQFTLVSIINYLIQPSLTQTEIRLISTALVNLLLHAASPQSIILKAILWGGGLGVLITCEDIVKWNTDLARVPSSRFRRAGHAIMSIGRFRALTFFRPKGQAPDSEGEIEPLTPTQKSKPSTRPRAKSYSKMSFYTSLTPTQVRARKWGYALAVYGSIIIIVMLGLRPYIATRALEELDPFLWAPAYLLCGQSWYQDIVDALAPGAGYCVTTGSASAANLRLSIIGYWLLILAVGISLVTALLPHVQVDTRRKVFHGMVVAMFLIPGVLDPQFTHLCLSLALASFLILDVVRAGQLPPASGSIARFLQPFVDGRDLKGPVVVSHVFLLLGCGAGWWLTLAAAPDAVAVGTSGDYDGDGWDWGSRKTDLSFVSGVVSVGLGDAAASLVGRRFGRTKWGWRGAKSLEGSVAFMVAVTAGMSVGWWWIGGSEWGWGVMARIVAVGAWGSMVEAVVTGVNDNVVVPVGAWVVVRGLGL